MQHCGSPTTQKFGSELRHENGANIHEKKSVAWHELCLKSHDLETAELVSETLLLYVLKYSNLNKKHLVSLEFYMHVSLWSIPV